MLESSSVHAFVANEKIWYGPGASFRGCSRSNTARRRKDTFRASTASRLRAGLSEERVGISSSRAIFYFPFFFFLSLPVCSFKVRFPVRGKIAVWSRERSDMTQLPLRRGVTVGVARSTWGCDLATTHGFSDRVETEEY